MFRRFYREILLFSKIHKAYNQTDMGWYDFFYESYDTIEIAEGSNSCSLLIRFDTTLQVEVSFSDSLISHSFPAENINEYWKRYIKVEGRFFSNDSVYLYYSKKIAGVYYMQEDSYHE